MRKFSIPVQKRIVTCRMNMASVERFEGLAVNPIEKLSVLSSMMAGWHTLM